MRSNWFEAFFPQRGLEVPCVLEFTGNIKDTAKAKQLILIDAWSGMFIEHHQL